MTGSCFWVCKMMTYIGLETSATCVDDEVKGRSLGLASWTRKSSERTHQERCRGFLAFKKLDSNRHEVGTKQIPISELEILNNVNYEENRSCCCGFCTLIIQQSDN